MIKFSKSGLFNIFKFFRKNMFIRMLFFYSCFTVAIIILTSFILIKWSSNNLEKEIQKSNMMVLNQFKIYSDTYLLKRLSNIVLDNCLESSSDNSIYNFFTHSHPSDLQISLDAWNSISSIVSSYDYIDSIYIYRQIDNTLVSSREGIAYDISSLDSMNRKYINYVTLKKANTSNINQGWISPLENSSFNKDKIILSYYYNFPIVTSYGNYRCTIMFNINEEQFFAGVLGTYNPNNTKLMIIDNHGNFLAHSNKEMLMKKPEIPDDIMTSILVKDSGFMLNNSTHIPIAFTWTKSSLNNWKYVSTISANTLNKEVQVAMQLSFGMIVLVVIICIIGLGFITSKLYRPLKNLILNIHSYFNSNDNDGDLSIIGNVITRLTNQVKDMGEIIENNSPVICYKLALDIIQGNIKNYTELTKRLKLLDITFNFKYFGIMITEIMLSDFEKLPFDQREYLTARTSDIIYTNLKNKTNLITVCHPAHCILSIINYEEFTSLKNILNTLPKQLYAVLGISINISLSNPYDTLLDFNKVYIDTFNNLKYSFIFGMGNLFLQDILCKLDINNIEFGINDIKRLESFLFSNKIDSFKSDIEEITIKCKNLDFDIKYTKKIIEQVTDIVFEVLSQKDIEPEEYVKMKSVDTFQYFYTIDEWKEWILGLADIYNAFIAQKYLNINKNFIQSIIDYIQTHIDNQLSLNSVAVEFKITPNYLSRIFKESTGSNFSDFVTEKKFLMAKELLSIDQKKKISDIAESLGYLNSGYFIKLFKERFGVTPVQYRKKYLSGEYTNEFLTPPS